MNALGRHFLVEMKNCNPEILKNIKKIKDALVSSAKKTGATVIKSFFYKFSPFGITGIVIIAESHLSIHTWPEYCYAAADIFTCGSKVRPETAFDSLVKDLECKNPSVAEFKRGILTTDNKNLPHKIKTASALKVPET